MSQQDKQILEDQKTVLKEYQNVFEIDKGDGTKISASEITAILNTKMLCTYIDTIKEGNYGNNLDAYKKVLNNKIEDAENKKTEYDERYNKENKLIVGDPDADSEDARLGYNGRSAQFRTLSDPNYIKLQQDIITANENMSKFKSLSDKLDDFTKYLEECKTFIENDFETGAENAIYQQTLLLKEEINKENINTGTVISISEEIYSKLIENNISTENDKIREYASFKNNVKEYKIVIEQKQELEKEIKELNDYSSELLLEVAVDSNHITTDQLDKSFNSVDSSASTTDKRNSDSDKAWKITWSNHLFKIQSALKELPAEYSKKENSSDNISLEKDKTIYLEEISDRRRLYLTDINDFDRAWTLLFTDFHPLKYKLMLFVSVIIAFGLDLISFSMGCLLSKIKV